MPEKKHEYTWKSKVVPVFDPDNKQYGVRIDEWEEFHDEIRNKRTRFMNLQEGGIRKALMALGWTPPENEEIPHA